MTQSKTKSFDIEFTAYGYGMMALSTTIVILLLNGFFQKLWPDIFATWFTVALAAASGGLAVAMVKTHLPQLKKPLEITYITLLFIILLGCYLTCFFGYSEAYILYFLHPFPWKTFSFDKFMQGIEQVWLAVTVAAVGSTASYILLQIIVPYKKNSPESAPGMESDGLAE